VLLAGLCFVDDEKKRRTIFIKKVDGQCRPASCSRRLLFFFLFLFVCVCFTYDRGVDLAFFLSSFPFFLSNIPLIINKLALIIIFSLSFIITILIIIKTQTNFFFSLFPHFLFFAGAFFALFVFGFIKSSFSSSSSPSINNASSSSSSSNLTEKRKRKRIKQL